MVFVLLNNFLFRSALKNMCMLKMKEYIFKFKLFSYSLYSITIWYIINYNEKQYQINRFETNYAHMHIVPLILHNLCIESVDILWMFVFFQIIRTVGTLPFKCISLFMTLHVSIQWIFNFVRRQNFRRLVSKIYTAHFRIFYVAKKKTYYFVKF